MKKIINLKKSSSKKAESQVIALSKKNAEGKAPGTVDIMSQKLADHLGVDLKASAPKVKLSKVGGSLKSQLDGAVSDFIKKETVKEEKAKATDNVISLAAKKGGVRVLFEIPSVHKHHVHVVIGNDLIDACMVLAEDRSAKVKKTLSAEKFHSVVSHRAGGYIARMLELKLNGTGTPTDQPRGVAAINHKKGDPSKLN